MAKISDLGVAKAVKLDSIHSMTKAPGTSNFMPPEALVESSKYGASLDVFSYGGVALFVISQEWPVLLPIKRFDESLNRLVILTEVERRQKYVDKMKDNAKEIKSLIISCLDENPKIRPPTAKILAEVKVLRCNCQDNEKKNYQQHLKQQQHQKQMNNYSSEQQVTGSSQYSAEQKVTHHSREHQRQMNNYSGEEHQTGSRNSEEQLTRGVPQPSPPNQPPQPHQMNISTHHHSGEQISRPQHNWLHE